MVLPSPRESAAPTPGRAPRAATRSLIRSTTRPALLPSEQKLARKLHFRVGAESRIADRRMGQPVRNRHDRSRIPLPRGAADDRATSSREAAVTPRPNLGETSGFSRGSPWVRAARRRGDGPRAARTCGRKRQMRPAGSPICGGGRAARSRAGGDRPRTRNSTSSRTGNASGYTISTPMPRWCVTPEHERGGRARRRRATVFSIGSPEPRLGTRETVGPACVFDPHAFLFLFLLATREKLRDARATD
jgi:hypothetical protein